MKNKEIIKKIKEWQKCGYVHQLTCGNKSSHKPLKPIEKNNKVILICENCDYTQEYIPEMTLKANIKKYTEQMDKMLKGFRKGE